MSVEKIPGSNKSYRLSPEVKRYTLLDNNFIESQTGKFRLEQSLGEISQKNAPKIKISVSKDLNDLKIRTTSANGLRPVNIFQGDKFEGERKNLEALLYALVEGQVLEAVE